MNEFFILTNKIKYNKKQMDRGIKLQFKVQLDYDILLSIIKDKRKAIVMIYNKPMANYIIELNTRKSPIVINNYFKQILNKIKNILMTYPLDKLGIITIKPKKKVCSLEDRNTISNTVYFD